MIALAPGTKHHGTETERAHVHAGTSKAAVVHRDSLETAACALSRRTPPQQELRTQEANAFCLSFSNSSWVMVPLSSRFFADAICSAGLLPVATDWMYWSVAT